ncbi:synaptotagmin-2 [Austrofundulus limnaeus]|uniref:Synaptotagmin-2 n=1 Tax=Austrofundulus limnaeus TaxID=52670 RepID=A0A2I4BIU6_AUSLI|nr:PREDICTED: synaptotagmin-2-like [Austrofundulus limnaeus]
MLTFTEHPGSGGPPSAAGELRMPLSDAVKYCILGISVLLLLLALAILAWQAFRCFSQTVTYWNQDPVNSDLLFCEEKPATAGKYSTAPSTSVEDVSAEAHRLSRCLSQASFPPEPAAGETRHDKTNKKVSGSLSFSVYLDQLQPRLVVTILQVEGLQGYSQTASLQLFVKIRLMCSGSGGAEVEGLREQEEDVELPVLWTVLQEWRTRIVRGSCRPLFGDQFSYSLQEDQDLLDRLSLRMEVRDFDKFSRHTVLGEVRVPLDRINITYPVELQEDLQTPQKDLVGEVLLSLRFLPTSQRLEVGLLKVRTPVPEVSSETALYARISLQCNHSRSRYQKTTCVARCPVTVFNEVLMFSLPDPPLLQCQILVSVFEVDTSGKQSKRVIGQLSVGKERGSEDQHWVLMVRSVRQPVAQWHRLLL